MKKLFYRSWLIFFVFVATGFSLLALPSQIRADDSLSDDTPVPELTIQTIYNVPLKNGDSADVHFPNIPSTPPQLLDAFVGTFPLVAVLQGANVDKEQYTPFARRLARRGFVVVVANHFRFLGPPPPQLFSSSAVITAVLETMKEKTANLPPSLYQVVDTSLLALVGHSVGGVVGLYASEDICSSPIFCEPPFSTRPPELKAAVFYGTNLVQNGSLVKDLDTADVAVALLQGSRDGLAIPDYAAWTYSTLEQPRALITINGANHYGICKDNPLNPPPAVPIRDPNQPTLSQSESISLSAKWTALWLRAQLKSDAMAKFKIYGLVPTDDEGKVHIQTN